MNANNPFRWLQRMCWPIVDLKKIPRGVFGYGWFIADALKFRSMGGRFSVWDMIPRMDEKVASEAYDRHYLLQDYWAFSEIAKLPHKTHTDIS
ncbi:MAG: hypothetical protein KGH63_03480, partial [Candidatus Micrarchaeota archaeon]|nr:hypothetical protein [Candidatus Micrarchaeota archaeon]